MNVLNMRRREARDRHLEDDAHTRLENLMGFDPDAPVSSLIGSASEPEPEPEPDPEPEPEPEPDRAMVERSTFLDDTTGRLHRPAPMVAPQRALSADVAATMTAIVVAAAVVPGADSLVAQAHAFTVTTEPEWTAAIELFDVLRQVEAQIHAYFDEDCDAAHKLWKSLTDKRGAQLKPIEQARKLLGDRAAAWKASDDRRKADEARRREQQLRDEQAAEANRQARALTRAGDLQAAREVIEEAKVAPRPVVAPEPRVTSPKAVTRTSWVAHVVDWPALRAQIGRGECPEFDQALQDALQPLLTRQAGVLKGELGKRYQGTEGREKATTAGR